MVSWQERQRAFFFAHYANEHKAQFSRHDIGCEQGRPEQSCGLKQQLDFITLMLLRVEDDLVKAVTRIGPKSIQLNIKSS